MLPSPLRNGAKPPFSGPTPAGSAYRPLRPMHSTPTSSWQLVRRQSVNRVIRSSSRRRMSATSPAIATPACGRPLLKLSCFIEEREKRVGARQLGRQKAGRGGRKRGRQKAGRARQKAGREAESGTGGRKRDGYDREAESGTGEAESGTGTILTRWAESGTGRKRDGYDIDKMGSFGLWFGDATNSAGRFWWNGFSRLESLRGANAVVRESGRLPSIRAGFAGYS